jgi:hypothetical protein
VADCTHSPAHVSADWAIVENGGVLDRFESKIAAERYLPGYPGGTVEYSPDPAPCGDDE